MQIEKLSTEALLMLSALNLFKVRGGTLQNGQKFSDNQEFCSSFSAGQTVEVEVTKIHGLVSVGQTNSAKIATGINALKAIVTVKVGDKTGTGQIYIHDIAIAVKNGGKYTATVSRGEYDKRTGTGPDNTPVFEKRQWAAFASTESMELEELKLTLASVPEFSTAFKAETIGG